MNTMRARLTFIGWVLLLVAGLIGWASVVVWWGAL